MEGLVTLTLIVVAAACGCLVVLLRGSLRSDRDLGRRSLTWPSTAGRITREWYSTPQHVEVRSIFYEYQVGGRSFQSMRVQRGGHDAPERYQVGDAVAVYYDPSRPDRCVLEPGEPGWDSVAGEWWLTGILAGGGMTFGIAAILRAV
jgi:hypothetical protein